MRTEQLQHFVETARRRSLSAAAKVLCLTQQAVSVSIKNLEQELGVPLLDRTSRGCGLTPAGERVMTFAESVLAGYQSLREEIQAEKADGGRTGRQSAGALNIYSNTAFYFFFHPQIIKNFCREYPRWKLSITELPAPETYKRLASANGPEEWNIGIVNIPYDEGGAFSPLFAPPPHLPFYPLMRGGYHACVSPLSPLAGHKSLSLDTLFKYPMIMGASAQTMRSPLHHLLERHGKPHFVFSAATPNLWGIMIASNAGVGLLHYALMREAMPPDDILKNMVLIPVREKMEACTGYVLPHAPSEVVQAFIDLLPHDHTIPA